MASRELPNVHAELVKHARKYAHETDDWLLDRYLLYTDFLDNGDRNGPLLPHHAERIGRIVARLDFELGQRHPNFNQPIGDA